MVQISQLNQQDSCLLSPAPNFGGVFLPSSVN